MTVAGLFMSLPVTVLRNPQAAMRFVGLDLYLPHITLLSYGLPESGKASGVATTIPEARAI